MANIEDLAESFKSLSELQTFSIAQQKLIESLNKKVKAIEEENAHLKIMLESNVPSLNTSGDGNDFIMSDEETISRIQLKKLKEWSMARDLTLDEARRVEIYTKIIHTSKEKYPDKKSKDIKSSDDNKLIELIENVK